MEPSTQIVFKLKDSHVACVGHLRELQRKIEQEFATKTTATSQNLDMGGFSIVNLPDMSNDFNVSLLGDSERTHAVRKQYLRENFATINDNLQKINRSGDTMTGPLVLSQDAESDMQAVTKRQLNDVELEMLLYAKAQEVTIKTRQLGERIDVLDTAIVTKANVIDTYTKTAADDLLSLKANVIDTYTKTVTDAFLLLKSDKTDTYTKTQVNSIVNAIPVVDLSSYATKSEVTSADALLANKTDVTAALALKSDKTVVDAALATKKNVSVIESRIAHSTGNSSLECTAANRIEINVNGSNRGYLYQPTGQATNPLGIYSNDKLQLQSALSSISVYGSKPFSTVATDINTHGFYVTGIDDVTKNVQSTIGITQGSTSLNLSTGHMNLGAGQQNFSSVSGTDALLISGGQPLVDPMIQCYSNSRATQLATVLPIQCTSKMGYSTAMAITDSNQFVSKTYSDTQDALKLNLAGGTLTGDLVLKSNPTIGLHPATKQYVDSLVTGVPQPDLSVYVAKSGSTMSGNLILSSAPTSDLMASTKKYVDDKVTGIVFPVTETSSFIKRDGTVRMNNDLDMGSYKLVDLATCAVASDAANKGYVDAQFLTLNADITSLQSSKQTVVDADAKYVSKSLPSVANTLTMNSNKITTLAPGSLDSDATNLAQVNALIAAQIGDKITQLTADNRYYRNTVSLSSISTATAAVNLGGNRITNLGTPTQSTDAVTKSYADALVVSGGGGGTVTNMIRSTDLSKTLVANANSIDFTNSGVTHLQIRNGEAEINTANWELKTNSAGASNKLTFRSSGVPTQSSFYALNFNDGGDKKTRIGSSSIDTVDCFLDYSLTNQQVQVPASAKLIRVDTSTVNVLAQEYVTRAYADSKIGSAFTRNDGSIAILKDAGVFVVSPNNDQVINTTIAFTNYSGKIGLKLFYDGIISRIAGSSYGLGNGLSLHPDQDDLSGNKLVIGKTLTSSFGPIRYDATVGIVNDLDLVTKGYTTTQLALKAAANASLSSFSLPTADIAMNSKRLTGLADPSDPQDGATKQWTLSQISSGGNQVQFGCRVLLGNVPFSSGSQNVVYSLANTGANFPLNPSSIITGIDWVRQSGRTDTIRLRVKLDPLLVNGRSFVVMCQPETRLVNTSGGPTSDWQYGDSGNQYVMQTFNLDTINSRFYVHIRDISDTATELLYLNLLIAF